MPDEITVKPKSEPTPAPAPASEDPKVAEWNKQIHAAIVVCSLAMIGCFFLPWVNLFLGQTASGYDLQQLPSNEAKLVWLIPGGAVLAVLSAAANAKHGVASISQIAGALPFLLLIFFTARIGTNLLQTLQIGAYLTLILAAALFVLPRLLKKSQS